MKIRALYPQETELIKKARSRDRAAQLLLYQKHSSRMLSVARYYIRDLQHAEDVMITAFYKAFTRMHQFKKEGNFEGWLRKIIVNEALSFLRINNRVLFSESQELLESPEPQQVQQDLEGADEIQIWIDQLPENQKIVFILFAIEGYTHKEIAKTLKMPTGTSRSYLSRARVALQKKWNDSNLKKNEKATS
jgi:RNA polymerase sigma factor (sigma-70 family)